MNLSTFHLSDYEFSSISEKLNIIGKVGIYRMWMKAGLNHWKVWTDQKESWRQAKGWKVSDILCPVKSFWNIKGQVTGQPET